MKDIGLSLRVFNNLCNSFGNLIFSLIAILIPENGDLITSCLVIRVLVFSMSNTQWERENQKGKSNSLLFDLLSIVIILLLQSVFSSTLSFDLKLYELVLLILYLIIYANFNILHLSYLVKGNIYNTVIGFIFKIVNPLLIIGFTYYFFKQNFFQWILLSTTLWVISFIILIFIGGYEKTFNHTKISKESIIINITEFIRGQFWIFVSASFTSILSISQIYFMRQILSPIALFLAAKRASFFDKAINENKTQINLIRKIKKTYAILFIPIIITLLLFSYVKFVLVLLFWIILILTQDIRAYQNRVKVLTFRNGIIILFIALFPIITLYFVNIKIFNIDLIYNIPAMIIGEVLIIYYLKKMKNDKKFY